MNYAPYRQALLSICCMGMMTLQSATWLPAKEDIASFVSTMAPRLAIAPALLCAAKALNRIQSDLGFSQTMLAGQLATLAIICWRQQKKPKVAPRAPTETTCKLGYLQISGTVLATEKFHEALKKCLEDQKIKGIILKIDAEWGDLSICQAMFKELARAARQKPLITLIEKSCCREPYLIATAGDCIVANEHSVIGMIGTAACFAHHRPDPNKELLYFYAGKLTPLGDTNHQITPHEQQLIAEQLELQYQQMCATIAEQRALDLTTLKTWAEGKPFLGQQALEAHLIDHIGTLSDAYDIMSDLLAEKHEIHVKKFDLVPFTI